MKKTNAKNNRTTSEADNHNGKKPTENIKKSSKNAKAKRQTKPKHTKNAKRIKTLSIYEKLFNAQQMAGTVLKTGYNNHHNYSYAKELDIVAEAKPILKEQRLTYYFGTQDIKEVEKKRILTTKFYLVNVDKPSEQIPYNIVSEGENKEGSVVGIPVAYTMALKYFLAKMLMLETGNDAELATLEERRKGKKGADEKKPTPAEEYEKHLRLIKSTRNVSGLIEFSEKLKTSKFYTAEQKENLQKAITNRVDELENA